MRTIPRFIHGTISNAERKLFKMISEVEGLENWYCMHSLGLSEHMTKREGEIDFLLVGPAGIFVIEVKGGRVRRENGIWKFTDRYGRVSEKRESPFTQARSAMYSLRSNLSRQFGNSINQYLFGYGVALPDIEFTQQSPEWDLETVFDIRDNKLPFSEYLDRLSGNWKKRQRYAKQLTKKEISEIVGYLRGDFETASPISLDIYDTESEIIKLTDEQLTCLDAMAENPRVVFQGGAGTGKTLLAVEQARRNDALGIRTLLLCYNKFLAAYLREHVNAHGMSKNITVDTVHGFLYETIREAGKEQELRNEDVLNNNNKLYNELYPALFKQTFKGPKYQSLIVDEAQDVLTSSYVDCLDIVIEDGIEDGNWYLFLDPENQKNIFRHLDDSVLKSIKAQSVTYSLSINCRNTKPIALQTEIISGINTAKVKKIEGMPVKYIWYDNEVEQAVKVSETVNRFLAEGVSEKDITILSPKKYSKSLSGSGRLRLDKPLHELKPGEHRSDTSGIGCGTIQSYKGLEASVIILTDIEELDEDWNRIVNYVGFTRARSALVVSISKSLKANYNKRLSKTFG